MNVCVGAPAWDTIFAVINKPVRLSSYQVLYQLGWVQSAEDNWKTKMALVIVNVLLEQRPAVGGTPSGGLHPLEIGCGDVQHEIIVGGTTPEDAACTETGKDCCQWLLVAMEVGNTIHCGTQLPR